MQIQKHRLKEYADIGVNRVSIGVQALNDRDLSILGRQHSTKDALEFVVFWVVVGEVVLIIVGVVVVEIVGVVVRLI